MGRLLTAVLVSVGSVIVFVGLTLVMMMTSDPGVFPSWYDWALLELALGLILPVPIALLFNLRDWLRARSSQKKISP